jgi:aspartate beta-hydroxylase
MDGAAERRIQLLIESVNRARGEGRTQAAAGLLRDAQAVAPEHPLVINEVAREMLLAGNAAAACGLLQQAVVRAPSHPSLWLNLAAALRGLKRWDEEALALEKVLALEPRNLRALLQKASLLELRGSTRSAAATYRIALQTIPPGVELPPAMRPALERAQQVVEANNRSLETFLEGRLSPLRERHADVPLDRVDQCLATLLQKERIYRSQPTFLYFPRLPAIEFYDRDDFPWLASLESATDDIRAEITAVLSDGPAVLDPYVSHAPTTPLDQWKDLNHSRRWGVYFLWREGRAWPEHIARCPRTAAALEAWPRWEVPGSGPTAVFSVLDAKTRIPGHTGVSNARLIIHLPLIVPPGCGFRVGAQRREWHAGKALVFDDTFEHEAWNDSDLPRVVLILDVWSPFLSPAERDLVRTMTAAVGEYYGDSFQSGV